jgi:hypothetical protein
MRVRCFVGLLLVKDLKQQVARSERSGVAGSNAMGNMLQIELKTLQQQVHGLNRQVRDLEDMVDHLAQRRGR